MPQRTTAEADSCEPSGLHHARPVDQTVIACAPGVHRRWPRTAPTTRPVLGRSVRANLSTAELYEDAIRHGEGLVAADGPLVVRTGKHTGRSPEDKFIVDEPGSHDKIWWGPVNRPISEADYDRLRARLAGYLAGRDLYSQDCFIGAAAAHRRSLRVYTETAWASIFARNLFRRPSRAQLAAFEPNFTIICVPSFQADPEPRGPAPAPRSSSTSGGWRSSSSGPNTPARSRRAPSRS